jgi:hypothetical protein
VFGIILEGASPRNETPMYLYLVTYESERKPSLDDLLSQRKPKPDWPS